jgi:hypothetical protein
MSNNQATPRILDREGNEIRVGSSVRRPWFEVLGLVTAIGDDGTVWVEFAYWPTSFPSRRRFTPWPSYRCPDLLLTQPASTTTKGSDDPAC